MIWSSSDSLWYDVSCDSPQGFFCQYPQVRAFHYHNVSQTQPDARLVCASDGQRLAMPYSREKFDLLTDFVYTQHLVGSHYSMFWIGLSDEITEGVYRWDDFSLLTWSARGNDPSSSSACVYMRLHGTFGNPPYWEDTYCGNKRTFVCQDI